MEVWRTVAQSRAQRIVCEDPAAVIVGMDQHHVEQLLDVALDNATRYAGEGAAITVTAREGAGHVDLTVGDDGPGLDAEQWDQAADRFWRGRSEVPGSGLGLSIAREIVEGQSGTFAIRPGPGRRSRGQVRAAARTADLVTTTRRALLVGSTLPWLVAACGGRDLDDRVVIAGGEMAGASTWRSPGCLPTA